MMRNPKSEIINLKSTISVVVPAFNAASTISDCLVALQSQQGVEGGYEIIVVDDGSTDGTAEIARGYGVQVITQDNQGPAAARNTGAHAACGELLAFTDADCAPASDWLAKLTEPFRDPGVAAAKGAYTTRQRWLVARFVQLEYESKYARMQKRESIDFIDTYSAAYRREIFLQNGGFDPAYHSIEDQELSFRLARKGYRMVFIPDARVSHLHDRSAWEYTERKFRIGYWKAFMLGRLPEKTFGDAHTPLSQRLQIILLAGAIVCLVVSMVLNFFLHPAFTHSNVVQPLLDWTTGPILSVKDFNSNRSISEWMRKEIVRDANYSLTQRERVGKAPTALIRSKESIPTTLVVTTLVVPVQVKTTKVVTTILPIQLFIRNSVLLDDRRITHPTTELTNYPTAANKRQPDDLTPRLRDYSTSSIRFFLFFSENEPSIFLQNLQSTFLTFGLIFLLLFYLTAVPFLLHIAQRDAPVLIAAPFLLLIRAASLGAGLAWGAFFPPHAQPRTPLGWRSRLMKRALDLLGGLAGLVISVPVILVAGLAIKLEDGGPVFFSQPRAGENGRVFRVLKLRSMVVDAQARLPEVLAHNHVNGAAYKIPGDPRVTRVGRFLRRWSLDELPQFWNVLKGDMSLVGPRPEETWVVARYSDAERQRLAVKPGLTGPMQVAGRGSLDMDARLRLELDYIQNYSLRRDLEILARSVPAVLSGEGAF